MMKTEPKYPISLNLTGIDGNKIAILARAEYLLKEHGVSKEEILKFRVEAADDLIGTCHKYFLVEWS